MWIGARFWSFILLEIFVLLTFIQSVTSLWCYKCMSNQPGCGKELSIRLQRWFWCPDPEEGGGENFCVKHIETRDGEQFITRDCLMTLRGWTYHRQRLPTVQRHGYCEPARNNDPDNRFEQNSKYCFCNDWNGCNTGHSVKFKYMPAFCAFLFAIFLKQL